MKAPLLRIIGGFAFALAASVFLILQIWQPGPLWEEAKSNAVETESAGTGPAISLRGGWFAAEPFQFAIHGKTEGADGLDIAMLAHVMRAAGVEVHLEHRSWQDQLDDLAEGRSDVAMGAFKPSGEDERFHYSAPYRQARVAFYVRKEDAGRYDPSRAADFLRSEASFRLGAIPGRLFQDPDLNAAIAEAARSGRVVPAQTDEENLRNLVAGRIDGFIADRLGIGATALKTGIKFRTAETVLPGTSGVHFIFSKKTVPRETVERVDAAIRKAEQSGRLTSFFHTKISSIVMGFVMASPVFMSITIIATIAAAISGFMIAFEERYTLFGAFVLAALPAVGGGVVRDVLLNRTPTVLADPLWLSLVIVTVLLCFAIAILAQWCGRSGVRLIVPRLPRWINLVTVQEVFDAAGLAAFTVSGVAVAVAMNAQPLWLWGPLTAMLSGAGGGILRDIVRQAGRVETLKVQFYAEVALIWGFLLSLYLISRPTMFIPEQIGYVMVLAALGAFVTRIAVFHFQIPGIPLKFTGTRAKQDAEPGLKDHGKDQVPSRPG